MTKEILTISNYVKNIKTLVFSNVFLLNYEGFSALLWHGLFAYANVQPKLDDL